jgi:hypothetical protein
VLAGLSVYQGEIVGHGSWEPILDQATWERLQTIVGHKGGKGRSPVFMLSGIIHCGRCGSPLFAGQAGKDRPIYRCTKRASGSGGCGRLNINRAKADAVIRNEMIQALSNKSFLRSLIKAEGSLDQHLEQLRADEASLKQLAKDHYVEHVIDRDTFLSAQEPLRARVVATKAEIAKNRSAALLSDLEGSVVQWWDGHTDLERRELVQLVFRSIQVQPAAGRGLTFDPRRIVLEWVA